MPEPSEWAIIDADWYNIISLTLLVLSLFAFCYSCK
ncbi:hypothetical protein EZ55_02188 [Alteromonas macleodii]|nr:hypothetical protein EZ55_02188 [Alteromonas macleodii]VTP55506.1 hypothetical protein EZ55_02188 [Alteromonas macleodii]